MAKPVIVSDLAAGADVVLSPPAAPHDRITGLRFAADEGDALAAAGRRLFACRNRSAARAQMGARAFQPVNPRGTNARTVRALHDQGALNLNNLNSLKRRAGFFAGPPRNRVDLSAVSTNLSPFNFVATA
jgi:hypothetical protein